MEKREPRKSELLEKIKNLRQKRTEIKEKLGILQKEYQSLLEELQPQIDELQAIGDRLAQQFRRFYQQSQDAYRNGDGALAKILSLEGREVQSRCEAINERANAMRYQLKSLLEEIKKLKKELAGIKEEIAELKEKAEVVRRTSVAGFQKSNVVTDIEVEKFLDELPQKVFKKIKEIKYVGKKLWKDEFRPRGETMWSEDGRAIILIGEQVGGDQKMKIHRIEETVAHEFGHVLYEFFLEDEQKSEWYVWHTEDVEAGRRVSEYSFLDESEDFAESFRLFIFTPDELKKYDEKRYNFINEMIKEMNKEDGYD